VDGRSWRVSRGRREEIRSWDSEVEERAGLDWVFFSVSGFFTLWRVLAFDQGDSFFFGMICCVISTRYDQQHIDSGSWCTSVRTYKSVHLALRKVRRMYVYSSP
jgi:hypothetical protein